MANPTSNRSLVTLAATSASRNLRVLCAAAVPSLQLVTKGATPANLPDGSWPLGQLFALIPIAGIFYTATLVWFAERGEFRFISSAFEEWPF